MSVSPPREAELQARGWVRQSLIGEPRLSEIVAEYRELGFEVHLEPVDPRACSAPDQCRLCFENPGLAGQFKVVYTRVAPGRDQDGPDA